MNPIEVFKRWIIEYGVPNLLLLLVQALRAKHQTYDLPLTSFSAYADAIEELIPAIQKGFEERMGTKR